MFKENEITSKMDERIVKKMTFKSVNQIELNL